ncbi:MAG: hypothetical protein R3B53_03510 [Candidatus Paceibacterota bacterium]
MKKEYFYIDINLKTKQIIGHGKTPHANLTGDTGNKGVHHLPYKGQFNKLVAKLN